MSVRICICIDGDESESLEELYKRIRALFMTRPDFDWESSNEWFDEEGFLLSESQVETIRMRVMKNKAG